MHLYKHKFFSALNILGLTLGLSAALWLVLFLQNELTFDQHHENYQRTYRLSHSFVAPGVEFNTAYSPSELSPMLKEEFPELESYARFVRLDVPEIGIDDQVFNQDHMYYADAGALDIFNIELIVGNRSNQLTEPNSILLSQTLHDKIFGQNSGLGNTIKIDGRMMKVSGVYKDLPPIHIFLLQHFCLA